MSLTWPLEIGCSRGASITFTEFGLTLGVEVSHDFGETRVEFHEDRARELRDWLSWWLGDGPEPATSPQPVTSHTRRHL